MKSDGKSPALGLFLRIIYLLTTAALIRFIESWVVYNHNKLHSFPASGFVFQTKNICLNTTKLPPKKKEREREKRERERKMMVMMMFYGDL